MRFPRASLVMLLLAPHTSHSAASIPLPPVSGFVANQGQAPNEALYYASVPGGALYLTREAIVLDTWETEKTSPAVDDPTTRRRGRSLWLHFSAPNPFVSVEGENRQDSRLNYFLGNDPGAWHAEVPVFERAAYREVWPGIDLTFTSAPSGVECELIVSAGADKNRARFELRAGDGTSPATIDIAGLSALLGADAGRHAVDQVRSLQWSTYLGGSAEETGWSAATDSQGNTIVTGLNTSTFFPTTPGAYDEVYSGLGDVFVSKLSPDGATLLWSTFVGGDSLYFDYGYSVKVDESDNPIVTGYTRSVNFPTTPGAYDTEHNGDADAFVTKLNAAGNALIWSTFLGGGTHDIGYDLDFDSKGNPVVAGRTLSEDFPTVVGAYDSDPNGEEDGFIAKLSAAGDALLASTFFGGSLYDGVQSIRMNASDEALVCGYTASTDFPGGSADGLYDIFVAKLSTDGARVPWSRLLGGSSYDYGTDLALDSNGDPIICGSTGSSDFPVTRGAYDESYNGDDDVVVAKLNGEDGSVAWATFVGGSAPVYEIAHGITIGFGDRPIVAGATPSADFPTTPGAYDTSHNGASDAFVLRLSASGSALEWSSFFGGAGDDYGFEIAKSRKGVAVTGSADTGFPVTTGCYDESYNGDISDVFVADVALALTVPTLGGEQVLSEALKLSISPNPVAANTFVSFSLADPAATKMEVFDVQGRRRAWLDGGTLGTGEHAFDWSALTRTSGPLPSGVYTVKVTAGGETQTRRIVLVR